MGIEIEYPSGNASSGERLYFVTPALAMPVSILYWQV